MTATMPEFTRTGGAGRVYPALDPDSHNPVNRTICPHCLGLDGEAEFCAACKGQPVCPTCRNGRVLSIVGSRFPAYKVCPDCCDALQDADGGRMRADTGLPMWLHRPSRQRDTIRAYQAARWRAGREESDDVPF